LIPNGTAIITLGTDLIPYDNLKRARVIAHEIGHAVGLADVYDPTNNTDGKWPNDNPNTDHEFMGSGVWDLYHIGRGDINGLYVIRHNPWYVDSTGARSYWASPGTLTTGWKQIGSAWYYFNSSTKIITTGGWHQLYDSSGYYYFFFDQNGVMQENQWISPSRAGNNRTTWGYAGSGGRAKTGGWHQLYDSGSYYYFFFDSSGVMQVDQWISPSRAGNNRTTWGYADAGGRAKTGGWHQLNDSGVYYYFFFDTAGVMQTDQWISPSRAGNSRTTWGYADAGGRAKTGWANLLDGGSTYRFHFDSSGNMQTGWFTDVTGFRYYLGDGSGRMQRGWLYLSSGRYYFRTSTNTPVSGLDGALIMLQSFSVNGTMYYANAAGIVPD
jgi:glucan-binding YG repeat protein